MTTFSAALASVADLNAAPEVAKTNSLQYELDPIGVQAFPSMHMLEVLGLKKAITMTYSNDESCFSGP